MAEKKITREECKELVIDALLTPIPLGEDLSDDEKDKVRLARLFIWGV